MTTFLSKRVGLHHICYEIDDLESGLQAASAAGFFIVSAPQPAVAFSGRRIAWVWVPELVDGIPRAGAESLFHLIDTFTLVGMNANSQRTRTPL